MYEALITVVAHHPHLAGCFSGSLAHGVQKLPALCVQASGSLVCSWLVDQLDQISYRTFEDIRAIWTPRVLEFSAAWPRCALIQFNVYPTNVLNELDDEGQGLPRGDPNLPETGPSPIVRSSISLRMLDSPQDVPSPLASSAEPDEAQLWQVWHDELVRDSAEASLSDSSANDHDDWLEDTMSLPFPPDSCYDLGADPISGLDAASFRIESLSRPSVSGTAAVLQERRDVDWALHADHAWLEQQQRQFCLAASFTCLAFCIRTPPGQQETEPSTRSFGLRGLYPTKIDPKVHVKHVSRSTTPISTRWASSSEQRERRSADRWLQDLALLISAHTGDFKKTGSRGELDWLLRLLQQHFGEDVKCEVSQDFVHTGIRHRVAESLAEVTLD